MSAGIDSAAVQRTRGRRNRNTGVPGCRRGLVACDAWRDDTPMDRGLAGWLAGWLVGYLVEQRRVYVYGTVLHRGKERVQRTGANFHLTCGPVPPISLSLFCSRLTLVRSAFRTSKKRNELADRAVAKLKDLLKNPTDLEPVRGRWLLLISANSIGEGDEETVNGSAV